ncbi:MAG: PAS domain S-box protein, partial [Salinivirgaceae bacterium]|nr:PAS domain S-box protein [Salinivirgaceae bacterium]
MPNKPSYQELEKRVVALEYKSNLIEQALNHCSDWSFLYNESNKIEFVSPGFETISGYKAEDFMNGSKTLKDLIHPDDYEKAIRKITPNNQTTEGSNILIRIITSQGKEEKVELESKFISNSNHGFNSFVNLKPAGIQEKIGELQKAKQRLEESNERFKALHNASVGGIAIHDLGVIQECNQGLCNMSGYTMEEIIGMDGLLLIAPENRDFVMQKIVSGYEKLYEAFAQHKNGTLYPIRIQGKTIPYKGKLMRVTEFRDLTEQNEIKETLESVINFNPISIQIVDNDGFILKTNPAHTTLFGIEPTSDYSVFNNNYINELGLISLIKDVKAGKITYSPDFQYNAHIFNPKLPDKPIWLRMIIFPLIGSTGSAQKYVLMHEDITDRKLAEEDRIKNETLLKQQNEEYLALNEELRQINEELYNSKEKIEENEQRLQSISNNLPDGLIYQIDQGINIKKRKLIHISQGVVDLHELTPEEVLNDASLIYNQIVEEDLQQFLEKERNAIETLSPLIAEVRLRLPSGKIEWRLFASAPRKVNNSIIWDGVELNINDRKISEQALKETMENYQFMLENINDIIWKTDNNLCFTYVSPTDELIRGYKSVEVIGVPIWNFMRKETATQIQQQGIDPYIVTNKSIEPKRLEIEFSCKDGSWIWIDILISPYFDNKGVMAGFHGITRNISKQKAAEFLQKESEERLQLSLRVNNASLFQNNFGTGEITSTPQLYQSLGYSSDEIPSKSKDFIPLVHPEDLPEITQSINKHLNGETESYFAQFRMRSKSGEWKWIEEHGRKLPYNQEKKSTILLGISRNIDNQKQTESSLLKNQQQLESFIRNAPVVLFAIDKDGVFTYSDGKRLQTLGLKTNELVGTSAFDVYADYPEIIRKTNSALKGNTEMAIHDMGFVVFDTHYSPIFDSNGNVESVIGVATDITERRKAEAQIRTLSRAIEQSPSSIIITNSEGRIEFVNTKFIDFMQYSLEDVQNTTPRIFNAGHIANDLYSEMWETLKSGKVWEGEFLNRKKDGTQFWESVIISPIIDKQNKISNYILIMEDITEKKLILEELVIAKEKAEESNRLKSAFLQNMSHEIRTPMNAIIGFSDMIEDASLSAEKRTSFTKIIQNSSLQLLSIVSDILTISALETKQERVSLAPICINNIIVELLSIFKTQASNQNISLHSKQGLTDNRSIIYTDNTKLVQVFTNLITNALKFTHEGTIEFGYHLLPEENNKVTLQFFVKDTGIGISPDAMERIFERFSQANDSINQKYGGTGLGLAISKAFVELLGGEIWVESELNQGSTFYFTIPYKPVFSDNIIEIKDPSIVKCKTKT